MEKIQIQPKCACAGPLFRGRLFPVTVGDRKITVKRRCRSCGSTWAVTTSQVVPTAGDERRFADCEMGCLEAHGRCIEGEVIRTVEAAI